MKWKMGISAYIYMCVCARVCMAIVQYIYELFKHMYPSGIIEHEDKQPNKQMKRNR